MTTAAPPTTPPTTPAWEQYLGWKSHTNDTFGFGSLLLWRTGGFYELYRADAVRAADALGTEATTTDVGRETVAVLALSLHSAEGHIATLAGAGFVVVTCVPNPPDTCPRTGLVARTLSSVSGRSSVPPHLDGTGPLAATQGRDRLETRVAPRWAWEVLDETLALDAESGHIDGPVRDSIARAVAAVRTVEVGGERE